MTKSPPTDVSAAFRVDLVPTVADLRAGAKLELTLQMTNVSSAPAELAFVPSCASWEVTAWKGGKRADYVNEFCGYGGGCGGKGIGLVVEPGGKVIKHLTATTRVRKTDKSCNEVDGGPWPAGDYEIRLMSRGSFPLAALVEAARVTVRVKK